MTLENTVRTLKPHLHDAQTWPTTYLVDRLAALIGDLAIEYVDSTLHRNSQSFQPEGRIVVFTRQLVFVQNVESGEPATVDIRVVPRRALVRLDVVQEVEPETDSGAPSEWQWPWVGQLQAVYEGLEEPMILPSLLGFQESIEPFRAFLPSLVSDLAQK